MNLRMYPKHPCWLLSNPVTYQTLSTNVSLDDAVTEILAFTSLLNSSVNNYVK